MNRTMQLAGVLTLSLGLAVLAAGCSVRTLRSPDAGAVAADGEPGGTDAPLPGDDNGGGGGGDLCGNLTLEQCEAAIGRCAWRAGCPTCEDPEPPGYCHDVQIADVPCSPDPCVDCTTLDEEGCRQARGCTIHYCTTCDCSYADLFIECLGPNDFPTLDLCPNCNIDGSRRCEELNPDAPTGCPRAGVLGCEVAACTDCDGNPMGNACREVGSDAKPCPGLSCPGCRGKDEPACTADPACRVDRCALCDGTGPLFVRCSEPTDPPLECNR